MKNSVTAMYMEALAEKNLGELCYVIFSRTIILKFLAKGGEQIENVKETVKNCLKSNFLLFFCFVSRFVRDETEVKEPLNITNDTV